MTGGTNTGLLKTVNEKPACIGVISWGNVYHRRNLEKINETVEYHMSDHPIPDSPGMKLGKNHTHFLLVDDGYVNRFGGETQFRTNLEYAVIDHKRKSTIYFKALQKENDCSYRFYCPRFYCFSLERHMIYAFVVALF